MLRTLGRTELAVSSLCLGGNVFGWTADATESMDVLDEYVAVGGNFIDTADTYSSWQPGSTGGESETIIGNWLRRRGRRDDVVIATKVAKLPGHRGLSAANIASQIEASLRRLQTDYVDLYYAHEEDPNVPIEESLEAFDALVRAGKVRYVGASNFSAESLSRALQVSADHGFARFDVLQPEYNLLRRDVYEGPLRDLCMAEDIACAPFFGLARGFLTGKYREGVTVESARANGTTMYQNERGWRTLAALDDVAAAHKTTLAAVALAWIVAQPGIDAPIASARTVSQLHEIVPMMNLVLTGDEVSFLAAAAA